MGTPCSSIDSPSAAEPPWLSILAEDDELLVVNKPAGLVCHPTKGGPGSSLIARMRAHMGGLEEPRMVHRLDRETGGVMMTAKTSEVAAEWMSLFAAGLVSKEYLAVVHGVPAVDSGCIDAPLGVDPGSPVKVKDCVRPDGAKARTRWRFVARVDRQEGVFSVLRVFPDTGRKHQIRAHLEHIGSPIVGDKLYGGDPDLYLALVQRRIGDAERARLLAPHHLLHALRLRAPWRGAEVEYACRPSEAFEAFVRGRPVAWGEDPYDHRLQPAG
jgi:23S rRNA pseudouridine1911/1915/1917 synthase